MHNNQYKYKLKGVYKRFSIFLKENRKSVLKSLLFIITFRLLSMIIYKYVITIKFFGIYLSSILAGVILIIIKNIIFSL